MAIIMSGWEILRMLNCGMHENITTELQLAQDVFLLVLNKRGATTTKLEQKPCSLPQLKTVSITNL